ncbi:helix-turn-helix domain-containing protein [Actinoplanes sp. NPDC051851]|uniref:helix-turn-helix domain-containing protein n=1 Tax=Actinoplanes sp. NPDC051851 TaxID=3154753 RepID=UPI003426AD41
MIRIELDEPTLARTRIAISPLGEIVCGLFLLQRHPQVPWPYREWAVRAREVLRTVPATEPVRIYLEMLPTYPDFLNPVPLSPAPTVTDQLDHLRATPAEIVAAEMARHFPGGEVPGLLRPFLDDREGALHRLADGLAAYWDAAVAPYWPAMRSALDEEVLLRARALAADGPDALLARLHERIRWEPPVLTLVKPMEYAYEAFGKRLLLVPLIFSRGALSCSTDHPDVMMVTYQSRGAAVLAERAAPGAPDTTDRLAVLVGRGRAAVLRALVTPATTTALATTLGLAPSTVSEHLAALLTAGVVHRRRAGRRVLYGLEPAGVALVSLIGGDSAGAESGS